jgi:hypothetical protein
MPTVPSRAMLAAVVTEVLAPSDRSHTGARRTSPSNVGASVNGLTTLSNAGVPGVSIHQHRYHDGSWESELILGAQQTICASLRWMARICRRALTRCRQGVVVACGTPSLGQSHTTQSAIFARCALTIVEAAERSQGLRVLHVRFYLTRSQLKADVMRLDTTALRTHQFTGR